MSPEGVCEVSVLYWGTGGGQLAEILIKCSPPYLDPTPLHLGPPLDPESLSKEQWMDIIQVEERNSCPPLSLFKAQCNYKHHFPH